MSASVKGTTRVSSNDRKLMKDLWVASKDNPLEKNRQKRKLTQNEKQTRDDMPEERGKSAFKSMLKKQKVFDSHFESRKGDDTIAVQTIQQPGWSDFCSRQTAHRTAVQEAQLFGKLLKTRQKRAGVDAQYKKLIDWVQPMTNQFYSSEESDSSKKVFHFLGDFKNKRFSNYRQRCDAHTQKIAKQLTETALRKMSLIKSRDKTNEKTVELEFTTDYEATKHPRIILKCDECGESLPASIAKHRENRLFFHPNCHKNINEETKQIPKKFAFEIFSQLSRQKF